MGPFGPRPAGPASVIPVLAGLVRLALTGHGAEAELELTRLAVELTIPTGRGAVTGAPYELQVAANSFFTQPGFLRAWPDPTGTLLGSTYRLVAPEFPYQEDLYLAFPATGTSGEQAADGFFRVDTGLSDRWTDGFFEDADQRSGRVVAVWNRFPGSESGSLQLLLYLQRTRQDEVAFDAGFRIRQFRGPLSYTASREELTAAIALDNPARHAPPYRGNLRLRRLDDDHLQVAPFDIPVPSEMGGHLLSDAPGVLTRYGSQYRGFLDLRRPDLPAVASSRLPWQVTVSDPSDLDRDGVPDLTDPVGVPASPRLGFLREGPVLQIDWSPEDDGTWALESAADPVAGPWVRRQLIGATPPSSSVPLVPDPVGALFWRLVRQ